VRCELLLANGEVRTIYTDSQGKASLDPVPQDSRWYVPARTVASAVASEAHRPAFDRLRRLMELPSSEDSLDQSRRIASLVVPRPTATG
jgi:hypothetical protein